MQKQRLLALVAAVAAILSVAVLSGACGGGDDDEITGVTVPTSTESPDATSEATEPVESPTPEGVTVDVAHGEWYVETSHDTVSAGTVTFNVANTGLIVHNFKVARTDLDPGTLPVDTNTFMVDETQVEVLASSSDLPSNAVEQVTVDLPPGNYVLFCNIAGHYEAGVYTGFTVK